MFFRESETVELKETVVDDVKKEIIAFANCEGGKLYIGVRDDGTVIGVDNPDRVALQISNMVRDAIKPDITMFLHYETLEIEDKKIVAVEIQRGTDRPYYIAKKGLSPMGVYVRQGCFSVPAADNAIRSMIKETDGDRFETMRSLKQELTFDITKKEFEQRNVEFGLKQMQTLKMLDYNGIYSNLALLLSEQCTHTIKAAVFQGTDQTIFKDRREFTGSLMQQLNEAYAFIDFRNQTRATIEKLWRTDVRDYPEVAVREALLNLLVHRDYSFSASALISIYADRIEFVSIGGLLPGIELEDVMIGLSVCRNPNLADVFYRLQFIEVYGTGIRKIMKSYENTGEKPIIEVTKNAFKITLPNINAKYDMNIVAERQAEYLKNPLTMVMKKTDSSEDKVLELAGKRSEITRQDVEVLLGVSASTASRILRRMVSDNILARYGKARDTKYTLLK